MFDNILTEYQSFTNSTALYKTSIYDKLSTIKDAFELQQTLELSYVLKGLGGECGEILNQAKKIERDDDFIVTTEKRNKIIDELSDVFWYASEICNILSVRLEDVLIHNMEKLNSRKERGVLSGSGDLR